MSVIEILAPGLSTTVQDLGREGFGPMGISPSGAADPISLRLGNHLVANHERAPALEMTLLGGTFRFPQGAIIALAGSEFDADLDGNPVDLWTAMEARPGQTLRIGPTRAGARCYLCVQGGIDVNRFLGSASTHVLTGLGGLNGRPLRKGDILNIAPAAGQYLRRTLDPQIVERFSHRTVLRVTSGPQSDWFPESSLRLFYASEYRVAEDSSRMGLRLEGSPVPARSGQQMITEGVSLGAVQITGGGQPIILLVDQQTTGGYPKIANVISADAHRLGQLRPRDQFRFERIELEAARSLLREQEELLASEGLVLE